MSVITEAINRITDLTREQIAEMLVAKDERIATLERENAELRKQNEWLENDRLDALRALSKEKHLYRCFHCKQVFDSDEDAGKHFGNRDEADPPMCIHTRHERTSL